MKTESAGIFPGNGGQLLHGYAVKQWAWSTSHSVHARDHSGHFSSVMPQTQKPSKFGCVFVWGFYLSDLDTFYLPKHNTDHIPVDKRDLALSKSQGKKSRVEWE